MKVKLLEHTKDPDLLATAAARTCRSSEGASELKEEDEEKLIKVLQKTIEKGHTSVIEHANFTFSIEGISRACSHQLVRHRLASYSQQSQRHIKPDEEKYVTPPKIKKNSQAQDKFEKAMKKAWEAYKELAQIKEIPKEDSRFVLPNATKTNIVVTMNARSLLNFFKQRTCLHAQWEIRTVANKMLKKAKEIAPKIFQNAGPPCKVEGECPEDDSSCELFKKYVG